MKQTILEPAGKIASDIKRLLDAAEYGTLAPVEIERRMVEIRSITASQNVNFPAVPLLVVPDSSLLADILAKWLYLLSPQKT